MIKKLLRLNVVLLFSLLFHFGSTASAQIIISQYYEGTGTNKWIELTNLSGTAVNTASPQLKLGLWNINGTSGNIAFSGAATKTMNLNVVIPAFGTVLIGNTSNGTEIPYLTAGSAAQTDNNVIKFDGNDGVALLNSSNVIIDQFGTGINAIDKSYVRNSNITTPSSSFVLSQWTLATIATVQTAATNSPTRLNFHLTPSCTTPTTQPSSLVFGAATSSSISGSFTATTADEYLVVYSTSSTLTASPVNGTIYNAGNTFGNATVAARGTSTSISISGLSSSTPYFVTVFSINSNACLGGPMYRTTSPLSGSSTTLAPPCVVPTTQPTSLVFGTATSTSISGSFTATTADEYLVVYSTSSTLTASPVNGTVYNVGNTFGNATVAARGTSTSISISGLSSSTSYFVSIYSINSNACLGGPMYRTTTPLSGNSSTLAPPCVVPTTQPTSLVFGTATSSSISGSFTATTADEYLVVYSTSSTLTATPVNGTVYNVGNTFGNSTVAARGTSMSISISGLSSSTSYFVSIFSINSNSCLGGPMYRTTTPLSGSSATLAPPCVVPTTQPTSLVFGTATSTSISGSFTATTADEYLVLYSTSSTLTASPVNGTVYNAGNTFGNATIAGSGTSTSFSISGLTSSTPYFVTIFSINSNVCLGGPMYNAESPLTGNSTTSAPSILPCSTPSSQPTAIVFGAPSSSSVSGSFTSSSADGYLVLYSTSSTISATPTDGLYYGSGAYLGNAIVSGSGSLTTFTLGTLNPTTTYYTFIFAYNNDNCTGGPIYLISAPLIKEVTTANETLNYYYGNFHSHSELSDGSGQPADDFAFGDTANCMDFLGISDHNHTAAGMTLSNWIQGRQQTAAASTPDFLAMYGMEWGVISGGGHVLVYGVDSLLGWDAGHHQTYVPKNVYTGTGGLFNVINSYGNNAFATLAHPNNADFNGIMSTYDTEADDAVIGSAVENGPSTSTNTTYSNPPSSMAYLSFYRNMLARGYHLGPTIDHDNHNITHGKTAKSRTVVLSPSLSERDVLTSMRKLRFYATQDCSGYLDFKLNNKVMGTILSEVGAPTITVATSTSSPVTSLKIYSGVPGSGVNATILTSTTSGSITYTHTTLTNLSNRYYYIDVTQADGSRIISAPIWYTRNDVASRGSGVAVTEFFAINESKKVTLKWITKNECPNQSFTIERSKENIYFETFINKSGKGVSAYSNTYTCVDDSLEGDNETYYRLTQRDVNGAIVYTETKKVTRYLAPNYEVLIYPNPISDNANLVINNTNGEEINLSIYNVSGVEVYRQTISTIQGDQEISLPLQQLTRGIYFLSMKSGNYVVNSKISKL